MFSFEPFPWMFALTCHLQRDDIGMLFISGNMMCLHVCVYSCIYNLPEFSAFYIIGYMKKQNFVT